MKGNKSLENCTHRNASFPSKTPLIPKEVQINHFLAFFKGLWPLPLWKVDDRHNLFLKKLKELQLPFPFQMMHTILTPETLALTYKALESWILRPFSGWRYCFHGHFWKVTDSVTREKGHSCSIIWYHWSIIIMAKPLE